MICDFCSAKPSKVSLKAEGFIPLLTFIKHLVGLDFINNGQDSDFLVTLQQMLVILETEKHVPAEILKAVQHMAENRDTGLASIVCGLSQGKALVKQARAYADQAAEGLKFLQPLSDLSDEASGATIPTEPCEDWTELSRVINGGCRQLLEVQSTGPDSAKAIIAQSRKTLSEFAVSVCKSFIQHTASCWLDLMLKNWDNAEPVSRCASLNLESPLSKYSCLGNSASEIIQQVSELQAVITSTHENRAKAKEASLDTESAINAAKEFDDFLRGSGRRMYDFKTIPEEMFQTMCGLQKSVTALSDALVSKTADLHIVKLADIMAKARPGNVPMSSYQQCNKVLRDVIPVYPRWTIYFSLFNSPC